MSDTVLIALIGGAIGLAGTCFTAWMAYKIAQLTKLSATTHSLVNHQAIAMAKLYAVACRTNANLTKDPGYIRVADEAEKSLADMVAAQNKVDTGKA